MVQVTLTTNAKQAVRRLKSIRRKGVFAAERKIMDQGAALTLTALVAQWRRDFDVQRRSFPKQVLRARRSYVSFQTGVVRRPGRVVSIAADELLDLQIRGGVRRPQEARALFIRATKRRPRKGARTYRAGRYIWQDRKRGGDKYLGLLAPQARINRAWRIDIAVRRVERAMPRLAERIVDAELRSAIARTR